MEDQVIKDFRCLANEDYVHGKGMILVAHPCYPSLIDELSRLAKTMHNFDLFKIESINNHPESCLPCLGI